jgi:hypothetical protein
MTLKEIVNDVGKRVSLSDIVEDNTRTNHIIDKVELGNKEWQKFGYACRTFSRASVRMIGNIQAMYLGYAATQLPDEAEKCIAWGVLGLITFYFIDWLAYDKIKLFDPYKEYKGEKK